MSIKVVTFKSSLTLVGEVFEGYLSIKIKTPQQLVVQDSEAGKIVVFIPFLEYTAQYTSGIEFKLDNILCINDPVKGLEVEYQKVIGE